MTKNGFLTVADSQVFVHLASAPLLRLLRRMRLFVKGL